MPRRAQRRAFGSIREKSRGTLYEVRWTERGERRSKTIRGTRSQASKFLASKEVAAEETRRGTPTIGHIFESSYLPDLERQVREGKRKQGTLDAYKAIMTSTVLPHWSGTRVDAIKAGDVQEWLLTLTKPVAEIALVELRAALDYAVRYEYVDVNKLRVRFEMPIAKSREKIRDVYTLDRAREMFERLYGTEVEPAFILACFGGTRSGESCAVRCDEVKLVESHGLRCAVVPITRRMGTTGDAPMPDGDLKNRQSIRTVVIPEPYGTRLVEIAREKTGRGYTWLASTMDDYPLNTSQLRSAWRKAAGADLIPFSNLRASWRTFAELEWRIPDRLLEILMGHVIPGVTGRHYLRPAENELVERFARAYVSRS